MVFIRYQHVERLDADDTEGLTEGICHIFPKMDGANTCAYSEDGELRTMSRNRETFPPDEFPVFAGNHPGIPRIVRDLPGIRLYGEWMKPHTVRTYLPEVWGRWFVFDVCTEDPDAVFRYIDSEGVERTIECAGRTYLSYEEYEPLLRAYGIEYIPPLAVTEDPDMDLLRNLADVENRWMMGDGCGEGIVVKRYGFVNRYGRTVWAKLISKDFSDRKLLGRRERHMEKGETCVEYEIVRRYVDPNLVAKEFSKIEDENGRVNPGQLLGTVWHCLVTECMWDAIKRHRNPKVDFGVMRRECDLMVKSIVPHVFGLRES